jgi:hypothetical protein
MTRISQFVKPFPASEMSAIVNPIVNNAKNGGPECLESVVDR